MKQFLFIVFFILYYSAVYTQSAKIDSLENVLNFSKQDTNKVILLCKLFKVCEFEDTAKASKYINQALTLATDLNYVSGIIKSYSFLGYLEEDRAEYKKAIAFYLKSIAVLKHTSRRKDIANHYNFIGLCYDNLGEYYKAIVNFQTSLKIYEKENDSLGISKCLLNKGLAYFHNRDFKLSEKFIKEAIGIKKKYNDENGLAICYLNLGEICCFFKMTDEALHYYETADSLLSKHKKYYERCFNLVNIGKIYYEKRDYEKTLMVLSKALLLYESAKDPNVLILIHIGLSQNYSALNNFSKASEHANLALDKSLRLHLLPNIKESYLNLANIYEEKNPSKSLKFYKLFLQYKDSVYDLEKIKQIGELETKYQTEKKQKEIELLSKDKKLQNIAIREQKIQKFGFVAGFIFVFCLLIFIYRNFRIKKKANKVLIEKNAEIEQKNQEILSQAEQLSEINKELGKLSVVASETDNSIVIFDASGKPEWVNAGFTRLNGFTLEEFIKERGDNLFKMSSVNEISEIVHSVITKKKVVNYICMIKTRENRNVWVQTTLSPVLDKNGDVIKIIAIDSDISKLKEAEEEIKHQKEEIEAQRDEIETQRDKLTLSNTELIHKNKQIIDSITYAQLIQEALLPDVNLIRKFFPDFFIFFKPRNIVSGDFYWFYQNETKIFFAVADCTGHGVPGAFMSMIGTTLLNEIVKSKKIHSPSQILMTLNFEINIALKQQDKIPKSQGDGMDISFFVYDQQTQKLIASMANQSIVLINNCKDVSLIKGDIYSVGGIFGSLKQTSFTNHEINISSTTNLYLFTDGIKDQFNSENEKFGEDRLKNLFTTMCGYPIDLQNEMLAQAFHQWKGNESQTDDVLVAGIVFS